MRATLITGGTSPLSGNTAMWKIEEKEFKEDENGVQTKVWILICTTSLINIYDEITYLTNHINNLQARKNDLQQYENKILNG